jgi:hypothetical protein
MKKRPLALGSLTALIAVSLATCLLAATPARARADNHRWYYSGHWDHRHSGHWDHHHSDHNHRGPGFYFGYPFYYGPYYAPPYYYYGPPGISLYL